MTVLDRTRPTLEVPGGYMGGIPSIPSGLIFEIQEVRKEGTTFWCTLYKEPFRGSVELNTHGAAPPSDLFAEMAREWRGWEGTKVWQDVQQILVLKASSDRTGHITLYVDMRPKWHPYGEETLLTPSLVLDAGSLETIARDIGRLFDVETEE